MHKEINYKAILFNCKETIENFKEYLREVKGLSNAEVEACIDLLEGSIYKQIADRRCRHIKSIKARSRGLFKKLSIKSRIELYWAVPVYYFIGEAIKKKMKDQVVEIEKAFALPKGKGNRR